MEEIISYCGLLCHSCPIYLATFEPNLTKKQEMIFDIIRVCRADYGIEYKYEEINDCDGCKSNTGRIFFSCKDCKIKKCAAEKGIENCAYCDEYACAELIKIFNGDPKAETRLNAIRKNVFKT